MDFSKPDNARTINRLRVLSELRKGQASKAELSRKLGINKVSIGEMTDKMIAEGLIEEGEKDFSSPGRPGRLLSINKDKGRVFAFCVSKRAVSVSVSDLLGRVLRFERYPRKDDMLENIQRAIARMSDKVTIYGSAAIIPEDFDTSILPSPILCVNRAEAEAESEIMRIGKSDGMLFLSWSDTFDAAIIRNGELHHLPDLAHIKAQRDGECTCGGRGCLEAAASGNALLAKTGAESIKDLVRNNSYGYAVKEAMRPLAAALAEAVQALSASSVMITGELSQLSDEAYAYLQELLHSVLPPYRKDIPVYRSLSGDNGQREGAAIMALDAFFYRLLLLEKLDAIENLSSVFQT